MRIVGVDPGLSGAAALVVDGELYAVFDFESADGRLIAGSLADWLLAFEPDHVVIEGVHSMPGQGVASTFKFGRAFGTVEGVAAALRLPSSLLAPHHWKREVGVTRDKRSARALAARLWPARRQLFERVRDDGRAEAALIALAYARLMRSPATVCNNRQHVLGVNED